jgi:hypothetical protein
MPHFKCEACRVRLYSGPGPSDAVGDLCPSCGSLLEPVGTLEEVVGFRSIAPRASAPAAGTDGSPLLADTRLDAERWLDDGGSFDFEALALPAPVRLEEDR